MLPRPLGNSGIAVSPIALGTWAFGATVGTWGHVDDNESIAAINQAIDSGITLIDTAPIYGLGHSEEIVGKAIRTRRNEVVLATKCGQLFPSSQDELPQRCLKKESIFRECAQSLRRLQTDCLDLYQCHWPDPDTPMCETMEALRELRDQGKIRAIGLSNFSCQQIAGAREFGPIHCLQPPFSMLQPRAADDLLPYCVEHDIGAVVYSPLAKGILTGKFTAASRFSDIRARDPEYLGARFRRNLVIVDSLKLIAARYEKTMGQLAINWTITHPGVSAAIVGAKRVSQLLENIGGVGWSITDEDRLQIDRILKGPSRDA